MTDTPLPELRAYILSLRSCPLAAFEVAGLADRAGLSALTVVETPPIRSGRGQDLSSFTLDLDEAVVSGARVPSERLPALLSDLRRRVTAEPVADPALPGILVRVTEAYELSLPEPDDRHGMLFEDLAVALCDTLEGVAVFAEAIRDGLGRAVGGALAEGGAYSRLEDAPTGLPDPLPAESTYSGDRPGPEAVLARARALAALARRAVLEAVRGAALGAELPALRAAVEGAAAVPGAISPGERALMALNAGAWSHRTVVDATWLVEHVAVLAWALALCPSPPDGEMVELAPLSAALGPAPGADLPPPGLRLRSRAALDAERRRLDGQHLGQIDTLVQDATPPPIALGDGPPERFDVVAGLTSERLRALSWLTGEPLTFA